MAKKITDKVVLSYNLDRPPTHFTINVNSIDGISFLVKGPLGRPTHYLLYIKQPYPLRRKLSPLEEEELTISNNTPINIAHSKKEASRKAYNRAIKYCQENFDKEDIEFVDLYKQSKANPKP